MNQPVLLDLQALLTATAHEFQNLVSFVIGHLSLYASLQNKQMYCTNTDCSFAVHSDLLHDSDSWSLLNKLLRDFPDDCRLDVGLLGVLPSTTYSLLVAICRITLKKLHNFKQIEICERMGSFGERV